MSVFVFCLWVVCFIVLLLIVLVNKLRQASLTISRLENDVEKLPAKPQERSEVNLGFWALFTAFVVVTSLILFRIYEGQERSEGRDPINSIKTNLTQAVFGKRDLTKRELETVRKLIIEDLAEGGYRIGNPNKAKIFTPRFQKSGVFTVVVETQLKRMLKYRIEIDDEMILIERIIASYN